MKEQSKSAKIFQLVEHIVLAAVLFGGIGAYLGAHYANQFNHELLRAGKAVAPTAVATTPTNTPASK
jgi:hypothetical protein